MLNPVIEGRVRKLDCGQITDGAACIILATRMLVRAHAEKQGLKLSDIPRIKGWGHRSAPISLDTKLKAHEVVGLSFSCSKNHERRARSCRHGVNYRRRWSETHDHFTVTEHMAIDHSA